VEGRSRVLFAFGRTILLGSSFSKCPLEFRVLSQAHDLALVGFESSRQVLSLYCPLLSCTMLPKNSKCFHKHLIWLWLVLKAVVCF
jgi:hypothetical protein